MTKNDESADDGDDGEERPREPDSDDGVPLDELREDLIDEDGSPDQRDSGDPAAADRVTDVRDTSEPSRSGDTPDRDMPLSGIRDDIEERSAADLEEEFIQEDVGAVEAAAVWADLLMGEGDATGLLPPTAVEGEFQVVPKTLCHRCEFFGSPPTLHCTHEGTTIHETVDMDHYRVSSCPMVEDDGDTRQE